MSEQEEAKRPDPPVVAVLVPVVITMTAEQAVQYAKDFGPDGEGPAAVAAALAGEQDAAEAVAEALAESQWLNDGMTVTVLGAEPFPVGEPFPGSEEGYVTGLCAHRVARSEWAAGFRTCEHCHGVTVNG